MQPEFDQNARKRVEPSRVRLLHTARQDFGPGALGIRNPQPLRWRFGPVLPFAFSSPMVRIFGLGTIGLENVKGRMGPKLQRSG